MSPHSLIRDFLTLWGVGYTQVALKCFSGLARNAARFHPSKPCCALLLTLANNLASRSAEKVREAQKNKGIPA